jgi:hypothetical protein
VVFAISSCAREWCGVRGRWMPCDTIMYKETHALSLPLLAEASNVPRLRNLGN